MNKQIQEDIQFFMNRRSLNIDIGFRCPLECPRCQRQRGWRNFGKKVPGRDLTLDEIDKISDYYKDINFCGQLSDPVYHPKFPEILRLLYNKGDKRIHKKSIKVEIRNIFFILHSFSIKLLYFLFENSLLKSNVY